MLGFIIALVQKACFILLFIISSFLSFFRIYALTEFLGDQGRTGIVIHDAFFNKTLPLVGPPVLTGQHLGPFFYYLVGPSFILSNFSPLFPALFMASLSVMTTLLIFYVGDKLFGTFIGFSMALLYTVSPFVISQGRTLWDPTPIPFFVLLLILSFYKIFEERKFKWFVLQGFATGALIQLHYPNIFFIPLCAVFSLYIILTKHKKESYQKILGWLFLGVVTFLATLLPFLIFEFSHDLVDLKEILLIFLNSTANTGVQTLPFRARFIDLFTRPFHNFIPINQTYLMILIETIVIALPLITRRNFWSIFFSIWFISGIFAMSLFKGVIFDHYLNFLLPVPLFLLGLLMKANTSNVNRNAWIIIIAILFFINTSKVDIFSKGYDDIKRTKLMTLEIQKQANNLPFSFTLISSRSFSDLHYRYFFLINGVRTENIVSKSYSTLFLACEKVPCPSEAEIKSTKQIEALCYDPHCSGEYPKVDLANFELVKTSDVFDGRIFTFKRK